MTIDAARLTAELSGFVTRLEDDLRQRAASVSDVREVVDREYDKAAAAGRTNVTRDQWADGLYTQVAVGWVLGSTFVRFCEDNGLITEPMISGPGDRRRRAVDAQQIYYRQHTDEGERGWLTDVFQRAAQLPGLSHVLGSHNPLWQFGPSDDAVRELVAYWRDVDPEAGELHRDFTDPSWNTRFLGDLYQDLSEAAQKQYALLQTPEFVESFILDRTLDPALDEFGLDGFRMIDPACGSGHFLLGAFDRLMERWQQRTPADGARANAAKALRPIHGVDLNPFAVAIARFRLLVAALSAADVRTLAEAPDFYLQIATGDSLLHGPPPGQMFSMFSDEQDDATQHLFATEDGEMVKELLSQNYHAVVANPPYITPKDAAANAAYRRRYGTCHRQYSLAVPFMERIFDLAVHGAGDKIAGFTGQITANSFMKREFGTKVIEDFLATRVDLTHVIDTSGAYIPGHGTPTVILLGRNRGPVGDSLRAVLGIRGEPTRPAEPEQGLVWTSITGLVDEPGAENDYVSVTQMERERLAKHPLSLQGGGADALKVTIEGGTSKELGEYSDIGFGGITGEDNLFMLGTRSTVKRLGIEGAIPLVIGEDLRDWLEPTSDLSIWPYDATGLVSVEEIPLTHRVMWPYRRALERRKRFGTPMEDLELPWYQWRELYVDRLRTPLSIAFAFVATHNHFVLDRGGKVFKQSAPVIKLADDATEDDHLELLGLLNSSTACFWMKQVFHNKGSTVDQHGARQTTVAFENFYEFDGTKVKKFPIPRGSALAPATTLDRLAQELASHLPSAVAAEVVPSASVLADAHKRVDELRGQMVAVQEELDWHSYRLYGVPADDLTCAIEDVPAINKGERAFEIVLAQRMAGGEVVTSWFHRHGSTPITDLPDHWPEDYRRLVERRIELIESDRNIGLLERPEYKRRWNWDSWDNLQADALRGWLLDRLEARELWSGLQLQSVYQLADRVAADADFQQVAQLYAGRIDVEMADLVAELVAGEAVPYLAAWRYTDKGLRKRAQWERTWELQRQQDAGIDVGDIPVPPKYTTADFRDKVSWTWRGKLDLPKERFISYPGLSRAADPSLVVGWAGWDHLQQAQALAAWYQQLAQHEDWSGKDLTPVLAGLAELTPWLQQWHNDIDPTTGQRLGDFFANFVEAETANQGLTPEALAAWGPPKPNRGRRRRTTT